MRKKTIITAFLCFIFNYSALFCASDHEFPPIETEMKGILDTAFSAYVHDVYRSPSKEVKKIRAVKREIFNPDILLNFMIFSRKLPNPFGLFRFSSALSRSQLTPEIIMQTFSNVLPHPQIFEGISEFAAPQDAKDQKNLSMGALVRGGDVIISHDYKIFESGAESRLVTTSALATISQISSIPQSEFKLGIYTRESPDFLKELNEYLDIFWNIRELNETEQDFLGNNSRFSGTILATNKMLRQIPIIVDFSFKEGVPPIVISSGGRFYEILKELQETEPTTMNNKRIKDLLNRMEELLSTTRGQLNLFNTILRNPNAINQYINFGNADEASSTPNIFIYGGYLFDIFKKIQDNLERLDAKNSRHAIAIFQDDFKRTQDFIKEVTKAFDNDIYSRFCSEQKVLFNIYRLC